ncbi:MAG: amino acid permease [Polyangiaceae bacterium]|nr:amino acid permease [Polyangiaceae bacterium]
MTTSDNSPERTLGLVGATLVGVSAIVGGGILVLAGVAFSTTGPGAILAFALNGVIALLTALSFAEMSANFPESGGAYTFAKKVLSVRAAFAVGWILWFAYIVAGVLYALGFASFAATAVRELFELAGHTAPDGLLDRPAVICLALVAVVGYAISLVRSATGGGQWVTWGKLIVFVILIATGFWALSTRPDGTAQTNLSPFLSSGFPGLLSAMGFTFIALQGFDLISAIAGEVKDPGRVIPRAMLLSLGAALVIYMPLLFVVSTVGVQPDESIVDISREHPETVMAVAVRNYLGVPGYWLVMVAAVLSTLSALQASLLAASRIALSMARDRTLPVILARRNPQRGTPVVAIYATTLALITILLIIPDVASAGAAASLIFLMSFALAHLTNYLARTRRRGKPSPFQTPWFPAIPVLGGVSCTLMATFQAFAVPSAGAITVVWLGLGGLLYLGLFSGRARAVDAFAEARDPDLVVLRGRSPLVLVPLANPKSAAALVGVAGALAPRNVGRVLLLTVMDPQAKAEEDQRFEALDAAQKVLREALAASVTANHTPETLMTFATDPWTEIIRVSREHSCEGLLLGRSNLDIASGGKLEDLMSRVNCDVSVLHAPDDWRISDVRRILVIIGGRGHHSEIRARLLGSLCRTVHRDVSWLRIVPTSSNEVQLEDARTALRALAEDKTPGKPVVEVVRDDDVVSSVAAHAKNADLVVLGLARDATGRRVFGGVTLGIAAATDCATIMLGQEV